MWDDIGFGHKNILRRHVACHDKGSSSAKSIMQNPSSGKSIMRNPSLGKCIMPAETAGALILGDKKEAGSSEVHRKLITETCTRTTGEADGVGSLSVDVIYVFGVRALQMVSG
jgi:hypothetical protein